ncbi:MAG: hypothetical protein HY898_28960 [Deltaproteobacteria bacterium]|nr:hypothetical protein [Deltaproteobacteria bacterium]
MQLASSHDHGPERRGLRPAQRRIVRAIAQALLSDADERGLPIPPDDLWLDEVVDDFDKMIGAGSPDIRRGFFALTMLMERMPVVMMGSVRGASKLSLADRIVLLEALENSRMGLLATLMVAFKIPITMIAYDQGEALAMTGFDRPTLASLRGKAPIRKPKGSLLVRPATGGRA